jgi:tetratricopeptide (TPR) repeat protein
VSVKRLLYFLGAAILVASCSTKKNTFVHRGYHNLTARYNGTYYSGLSIEEGVYKIEKANKENFDNVIPVYVYPTPEKAKSTFPEFDKAIKKSSLCIQKHAIKDKKGKEIPSSGNWIDNNWINIGIAHFYKREFFSAIESFDYVMRTYTKSNDKYLAMIWLIRANNEIGAVSSSEQIISLLKNEKGLKRKIKNELPVVWADYYIRRGQNTEAIAKLLEATRNTSLFSGISRKRRARYSFIIAQLSEKNKDNKRAIKYYKKTISLKPEYEMIFYSKIKMARLLDVKRSNSDKTKKDLLKMAREFKNTDYFDVIYYTLGEIEEKERHSKQAIYYYKKSVQKSIVNPNQKALSYLKLGEINFDLTNYGLAESYYDSTIVTLSKDHPDYNSILARKKTLEALVGHIRTISREDSMQRVSKMSPKEQEAFIDNLIVQYTKEQERIAKEKAEAILAGNPTDNNPSRGTSAMPGFGTDGATFYFYNQTTLSFGIADFQKKWGSRKLEDNWRRSNKAMSVEDNKESVVENSRVESDTIVPEKTREFYAKNLIKSDSAFKKSNNRIIKAYYMMGTIYKEDLNNTRKAIAAFEELNTRFPENHYLLRTYYVLYRTYLAEKNIPKSDYYKEKILNEFPDSEFAALIKNPDIASELNAKKGEVEDFYSIVYSSYTLTNYPDAYTQAKEGISKFGKSEYLPKFEFIKSMSIGKIKGIDTLEANLKMLVAKYPKSDVTPLSEEILIAIAKQKNPEAFKPKVETQIPKDSFSVNFEGIHFIIAVVPDQVKIAEEFKTRIGTFNSTYYSEKIFNVASNLFGEKKQLIIIKSFTDAKDAVEYYNNLMADPEIFKGEIKKEEISVFPIFSDNLPILYKSKNVTGYSTFYKETYQKINAKN